MEAPRLLGTSAAKEIDNLYTAPGAATVYSTFNIADIEYLSDAYLRRLPGWRACDWLNKRARRIAAARKS